MPLNGNYEPIDIKWSSNEARAWEKQVKEMLNYSLTRTATVLRNTKRVYEEAKFEKTPRKISIGPEKPSDKKMKKESVRIEYSEKKEWARLRIEEYAKSQKIILEIGKFLFKTDYKKEFKTLWEKIESFKDAKEYFSYDDQSLEGKLFITSHNAAANQGFANRSILTHQLDQTIEKTLGKNPELDMLYDMPHVYIHRENHFGKDVWMHRNGTVRANGQTRMNHPVFSQTGEPVFIPSSMSTPAYICAGTDENTSTFFSASHGTGRRKIHENNIPQDKQE